MQGVFMNTRRFLATAFLAVAASLVLFAFSGFAPSLAQGRFSVATVTVCNEGQIDLNVVIGTEVALQFFTHNLDVVAWVIIKPGTCRTVYHGVGDSESGEGVHRSYMGFGFYNSQSQLIAGHASRLPDFGTWTFGTPILAAAADRFCVRDTGINYRIAEHAVLDCATFRTGENDIGGYTSFPTALEILPHPVWCSDRPYICYFGDYYLDVTATPDSPEIQIKGRIGKDKQPDQSPGPGLGTQIMQQLAKAAAEEGQRLAQEKADAAVLAKAQAEASVRGTVCVPDDLLAEWRNPPPGSKMEALQRQLKASLRERAKSPSYDQSKWMTVDSSIYSTWNPAGHFRGVVTATEGGSCSVGHREFLALTP
jgi:hypothetical protein